MNLSPTKKTVLPLPNKEGFIMQKGISPHQRLSKTNQLLLKRNKFFMTTDAGITGKFIPINAEWLRTGLIPPDYWMLKIYASAQIFLG